MLYTLDFFYQDLTNNIRHHLLGGHWDTHVFNAREQGDEGKLSRVGVPTGPWKNDRILKERRVRASRKGTQRQNTYSILTIQYSRLTSGFSSANAVVNEVSQVWLRVWRQWTAVNTRLRNLAFLLFVGLLIKGHEKEAVSPSAAHSFDVD